MSKEDMKEHERELMKHKALVVALVMSHGHKLSQKGRGRPKAAEKEPEVIPVPVPVPVKGGKRKGALD